VGVSPVRSEAKHRSESVARSTPTLPTQAQRSVGKGTPKKIFLIMFIFVIQYRCLSTKNLLFVTYLKYFLYFCLI
ncbi:MAG: hypothetical protein NZ519_05560, partial [Bacteroidia bacterium]|nr:hypothetical protein [Bacteroidia bacterium]